MFSNLDIGLTRKHGKAQRDGRRLGGSVSPSIECYWLVNASPLYYGRWVGQNSSSIFRRLRTKVNQIKFDILLRSRDIRDQVAKLCEIARNVMFWGRQISGEGAPNFWPNFINLHGHRRPCGSLVTIGRATSEISRRKKKKTINEI